MGIAQWIMIILNVLGLGISLAKHGTPREGYNSFWKDLFATAITFFILWCGGFFD